MIFSFFFFLPLKVVFLDLTFTSLKSGFRLFYTFTVRSGVGVRDRLRCQSYGT